MGQFFIRDKTWSRWSQFFGCGRRSGITVEKQQLRVGRGFLRTTAPYGIISTSSKRLEVYSGMLSKRPAGRALDREDHKACERVKGVML